MRFLHLLCTLPPRLVQVASRQHLEGSTGTGKSIGLTSQGNQYQSGQLDNWKVLQVPCKLRFACTQQNM